jgi:hypothetical protein
LTEGDLYVGAAALRAFAQTLKEESQLSGTGLEVSPGLTVSRERKTRHWRPMIVRGTLLTLTLLTSCLSPHPPDMLGI